MRDLKPGTKLSATITKTTTPVTVRTTTVGTARVWYVAAPNVILTLPSGENKQYTVKPDYKFIVNGQPATVFDLRAGMTVSAEKIVEEPTVEIATNSTVVGRSPGAPAAPAAAQAPSRAEQATAPTAGAAPAAGAPPARAAEDWRTGSARRPAGAAVRRRIVCASDGTRARPHGERGRSIDRAPRRAPGDGGAGTVR